MAFLDSQQGGDEGTPPAAPPAAGGGPPGPPQGGGPILAAIANKQRGPQISAPGAGDQANAMTTLMQAIGLIQMALPGLQPGTPLHQDALRAVTRLSRHIGQGQPTAGVQRTQLQDLLQNVVKNALLSKIMGQQKSGAGPNPDAPSGQSPMPGAASQAPMPSTPLPGA